MTKRTPTTDAAITLVRDGNVLTKGFDCWDRTDVTKDWLITNNATLLKSAWNFDFYECPIYGDEGVILAVKRAAGPDATVYYTNDYDLPDMDPMQTWSWVQ